jgi:catechol 2,3-dioxygenase-like lactoylglutathione lyase family enzyme
MSSETQHLTAITEFRLVTADLPRLCQFYQDVLGFISDGPEQPIDCDEMRLLGLTGSGRRRSLRFGRQCLAIDQFDKLGRPYPAGTNAASLSFQHFALVVNDIAEAYQHLQNATAISMGGPQHLPASSGGVFAFKFRDPDGHPLELLQFRTGAWQRGPGIDHSAISVADTKVSRVFYEALGLKLGHHTVNHGPDQARLDNLEGVVVAVVPMLPEVAAPHLELLGYRVACRDPEPVLRANDIAATRIVWHGKRPALLRDPDGHLQQITFSGEGLPP